MIVNLKVALDVLILQWIPLNQRISLKAETLFKSRWNFKLRHDRRPHLMLLITLPVHLQTAAKKKLALNSIANMVAL